MYKVKFADIGEGLTEGKVVEVLVKVGDVVKPGDSLFFVETDKVNSEIPAPVGGKIAKILIAPDQEIKVGQVVMEIEEGAKAAAKKDSIIAESKNPSQPEKKVIEENASVVGSTPISDEILKRNQSSPMNQANETINKKIKATPLARKMAQDLNIDLTKITPSGPQGRIIVADLSQSGQPTNQISSQKNQVQGQIFGPIKIPKILSTTFTNRDVKWEFEVQPMNGIRKATVKAMSLSHQTVAGFTGMKNIDLTQTVNARSQIKAQVETQGIKLTYLAFIIKATAQVLKEMPNINVQIDEKNQAIKYIKNINIGVAVDTPEGLIVPVIKQADQLSVLEIAVAINELATKAKTKKLTLKDISEASFTVTNFGSVGLEFATPIINAPEAAILGVGMMSKQLVYVDGEIQSRMMMPFSMTADHRIIDGADVGRFLQKLESYLKDPQTLLN